MAVFVGTVLLGTVLGRLNAEFSIWGPTNTWLQTSQDPNETYLSTTLPTGSYTAYLSSWQLERADDMGNFAAVQSTLTSSDQINFTIFNDVLKNLGNITPNYEQSKVYNVRVLHIEPHNRNIQNLHSIIPSPLHSTLY